MIRSLRGMKDLVGEDAKRFEYFIKVATKLAKNFGYEYIETPLLEETSLFKRSVGDSSDIVNKEMYQFIDKGGHNVCLRPEGTAGVVRSFIQNGFDRAGGVKRFFYYGAMFRYERPQKGRLRSFHQFGVESFGIKSVYEDMNVILLLDLILKELGIEAKLKINSLGCSECMPKYKEVLVNGLKKIESKLCNDCQNRIKTNPIRVFDCKENKCQELLKDQKRITDTLCESCRNDFEKLKKLLTECGLHFEVDRNLVRGLDYYNKCAFEFVSEQIGAQSSIAGGGRYDKLVEYLDGKSSAGVGFAIGIERLLELIKLPNSSRDGIYLGAISQKAVDEVFLISSKLRAKNRIFLETEVKKLKSHLKNADRFNVRYCAIIGDDELINSTIWVKDLDQKREISLNIDEFITIKDSKIKF